jgi:transposase
MRGCPHGRGPRQRPQQTRRGFTKEFKRDAVELVCSTGRLIAVVARELGIYDSTLGNCVRHDRIDRGEAEGLTTEERARLRQLELRSGGWPGGWRAAPACAGRTGSCNE